MNKFKRFVLARLREPSTWFGIINLLTAFGVLQLTHEQSSAIMLAVSSLLGVGTAAVLTPDKNNG
jgi:hypothetical protein